MSEISDIETEDIIDDLHGRIYYNPLSARFELKEKIIAGDVISKADEIEKYANEHPDDPNYTFTQETIKALREAIPEPIPYIKLDFNLGERWIPIEYYERYATQLFNTKTDITFIRNMDYFSVEVHKPETPQNTLKYGTRSTEGKIFKGHELFTHALVNTVPKITITIPGPGDEDIRIPDTDAIKKAQIKIDEMREGFPKWLDQQSQEEKDKLTDLYNRLFNSRVKPTYDGTFLTLPGLQLKNLGIEKLYESQLAAIWMNLVNGGGLVDHEVGLGKSLIMCVIAHELKRLKLVNKPMILALKANASDIAETFMLAYPDAKILYPREKDFEPKKREALFYQIQNNDWDAIIVTHDQFFKIPQSLDQQKAVIEKELASLKEDLDVFLNTNGRKINTRLKVGLIKRQNNLENKLKEIVDKMDKRRDDVIDFETMGVGFLLVDEWHYFKNLAFTTRYYRVAGLGNPEGSLRALNLLIAVRTLQDRADKDIQATFLTGTPISNSLVELYLLFKYLIPRILESQEISTFDAWSAVFAKKTTEYEFAVTGELKQKERFRYFIKAPELARMYSEITDYRTAKDANVDRPEGKVQLVKLQQTPQQEEFLQDLIEFARTGEGELIGREPLTDAEQKARMLIVSDLATKMCLDMRLIDPDKYTDEPGNLVNTCAQMFADEYHKYHAHKGTQLIFCDKGTPKPGKWNIYAEIKRKLIEDHHIPANEIRFVHEAQNQNQRSNLFASVRNGDTRGMIASTSKAGTGTNVQPRITRIYNLDIPWKTSDYNQRGGRGIRAGNLVAKNYAGNTVEIIVFATEKSPDSFKFNLLQTKQFFIDQIRNNNLTKRTIDEGAISENGAMDFATFVALTSDNKDLLEKLKLEREITALESEFRHYRENKYDMEQKLNRILPLYSNTKKEIALLTKDWELLEKASPRTTDNGQRTESLSLHNCSAVTEKEKGSFLKELRLSLNTGGKYQEIGTLAGFPVLMQTVKPAKGKLQNIFSIKGSEHHFPSNIYFMNYDNPTQSFYTLLERIPIKLRDREYYLQQYEKDIPVLQEIVNTPWAKEKDLKELTNKLKAINKSIEEAEKQNDENPAVTAYKQKKSEEANQKETSIKKKSKIKF